MITNYNENEPEWQATCLHRLLSTLGIKSTKMKTYTMLNGKRFDRWDITFLSPFNPFLCRNQDIDFSTFKTFKSQWRNIRKIERVDTVQTKCLEVDSPTHTFLVGDNLLVTHNTNIDLFKNFNQQKMLPPFDDLLEMPHSHYVLQLNIYQMFLENLKTLRVIDRRLVYLNGKENYELYKLENIQNKIKKIKL